MNIVSNSANVFIKAQKHAIIIASVITLFVHIFVLLIHPVDPMVFRAVHLALIMFVGFNAFSSTSSIFKGKNNIIFAVINAFFSVLGLIVFFYILYTHEGLMYRAGIDPTFSDIVVSVIAVLLVVELARRSTGWPLVIIAIVFVLYSFLGPFLPGVFFHQGYSFQRVFSFIFSLEGIYSVPLGASATYVYIFVILGAFLQASGAGKIFIDLAMALTGKAKGGPAKVSIVASAFFGAISGSAVANTVSTGAFTIPLMKKAGYKPAFAGAVEATSSTGGQLLPPVMGAAAFLMVDITGIPYREIAISGTFPAVLFFLSLFMSVHFQALKQNIEAVEIMKVPKLSYVLKNAYHLLIPIILLLYLFIIVGLSPFRAAFWAFIAVIITSWFTKNKIFFAKFCDAATMSAKRVVTIASACAIAGIIIGVMSLTGVGMRFASVIVSLANESLFLALILTMIIVIILGMGLPVVAAYAISASILAPALIELGLPVLIAHLFIFYFACISTITPPVALAAFAAAPIAEENPNKIGWTSFKLGTVAYVVPYMFAYSAYGENLILKGEITDIVLAVITAIMGVTILAASIIGYFKNQLNLMSRLVYFSSSIFLLFPGWMSDAIGMFIIILLFLFQLLYRKLKISKNELSVERE